MHSVLRWFWALGVALMTGSLVAPAHAHELRPAVIELTQQGDGEWLMEWRLPIAATRSSNQEPLTQPVMPESCETIGDRIERTAALNLLGRAQLRCAGGLAGDEFGVTQLIGRADAIARFIPLEGGTQSFRLTASQPLATIAAAPSTLQVLRDYFIIGAEHILFGWDHLLFVIALVMLVRQPWQVVKAATAFTIAHSITLVATTLGYSGLPSRPVEALIALSIVFLAVEVLTVLRQPDRMTITRRLPWMVAFGFGLFHGFGFAGALADIGLPQGEIAVALLAFNLGVEAGQLLVIALMIAVLAMLTRFAPKVETPSLKLATYAIGTIGSFWLIERLLGA